MSLLYGIHDREGSLAVPVGGWCVDSLALSENPNPQAIAHRPGINWILRMNWGYGSTGTIPVRHQWGTYLARLADFANQKPKDFIYVIGNEPNHEQERPNGVFIAPEEYANFFIEARNILKAVDGRIRVIPAALAPYHANPMPWTNYLRQMYTVILQTMEVDGLCVHTYARGNTPDAIHSEHRYPEGILKGQFQGFKSYRDALAIFADFELHHLPAYITEFNPIDGWAGHDTGIIQAAYEEINWWNTKSSQEIHCLCLYRWEYDRWAIKDNGGVRSDFLAAAQKALQSPQQGQEAPKEVVVMPSIKKPTNNPSSGSVGFQREIDPRIQERQVKIDSLELVPGQEYWLVKKLQWLNSQESQGRHHIFVDVVDENGQRIVGVPLAVAWPSGAKEIRTEAKPGEPYSANFPMSPSRNEFQVRVVSPNSEVVRGIGMGEMTPDGFNAGHHTSTVVVFQKFKAPPTLVQPVTPTVPKEDKKDNNPPMNLVHPVKPTHLRRITQLFGKNPEFYKRFVYDGVPLRGHNGIDYGTPIGTPIVAVDAGRIVESQNDADGWGEYIKIVHAWGESLYAHLSQRIFEAGENVMAGQPIALSGNTGISTGPHLHFGMRIYPYQRNDGWGGYADPYKYLEGKSEPPKPVVTPPATDTMTPSKWMNIFKAVENETGVEWQLLASLAWAESSFRPHLEDGVFQIGDATWSDWAHTVGATDIKSPLDNTRVAAVYIRWLLNYLNGDLEDALTAYNWGIKNVLDGLTPPALTTAYVHKVIHGRDVLKALGV